MFSGRQRQTKKELVRTIIETVSATTNITPQDIEITIIESDPANWGIRGRIGDELSLDYEVGV